MCVHTCTYFLYIHVYITIFLSIYIIRTYIYIHTQNYMYAYTIVHNVCRQQTPTQPPPPPITHTQRPESVFFSVLPSFSIVTMMLAPMGVSGHDMCRPPAVCGDIARCGTCMCEFTCVCVFCNSEFWGLFQYGTCFIAMACFVQCGQPTHRCNPTPQERLDETTRTCVYAYIHTKWRKHAPMHARTENKHVKIYVHDIGDHWAKKPPQQLF